MLKALAGFQRNVSSNCFFIYLMRFQALEESDIPVEVTCDEDALNAVDLRALSTPPYNPNKTAGKGPEHNTE